MKDPTTWIAAILIAALIVTGCGSGAQHADEAATPASASGNAPAEPRLASQPLNSAAQTSRRAVIRNGEISVRVENIEKAERDITNQVSAIGGYVDSSESSNLDAVAPTVTMKLRVPATHFDATLNVIEALGHRLSKSIKSEDVTGKIVDFDARLKIMRAQEESMVKTLKNLRFDESYTLQEKLMQLRAEIESITAQRKDLAQLAAMSTIEVNLSGDAKSLAATTDPNWAKESYNAATSMLGTAARGLGSLGIFMLVLSPFWVPVVWMIRRAVRRSPTTVN